MNRKWHITIAYLGLFIILMHGVIPHHHHNALFEATHDDSSYSIEYHHCDFSNHQQNTSDEVVCHFNFLSGKNTVEKFFTAIVIPVFVSSSVKQKVDHQVYTTALYSSRTHEFPSFRAPPALV